MIRCRGKDRKRVYEGFGGGAYVRIRLRLGDLFTGKVEEMGDQM